MSKLILFVIAFHIVTWALYPTPIEPTYAGPEDSVLVAGSVLN